jgi:hypothetical protein
MSSRIVSELTEKSVSFPCFMAMGRPFDLPYSVELWDDADSHVEELIALTGDYRVARAAFDEAVKRRPGRIVTLRQKTRKLADSRQKN